MNPLRLCGYTKVNGVECGSPAQREHLFCYFHSRWHEDGVILDTERSQRRKPSAPPSPLGNAKAVQLSIMKVLQQLVAGEIEHKTASLLLYGLQTATLNLRYLSPGPEGPTVTEPLT